MRTDRGPSRGAFVRRLVAAVLACGLALLVAPGAAAQIPPEDWELLNNRFSQAGLRLSSRELERLRARYDTCDASFPGSRRALLDKFRDQTAFYEELAIEELSDARVAVANDSLGFAAAYRRLIGFLPPAELPVPCPQTAETQPPFEIRGTAIRVFDLEIAAKWNQRLALLRKRHLTCPNSYAVLRRNSVSEIAEEQRERMRAPEGSQPRRDAAALEQLQEAFPSETCPVGRPSWAQEILSVGQAPNPGTGSESETALTGAEDEFARLAREQLYDPGETMGATVRIGGAYTGVNGPNLSSNAGLNNPLVPSDNSSFGPLIDSLAGYSGYVVIGPSDFTSPSGTSYVTDFSVFFTHAEGSASATHPAGAGGQNVYTSLLYPEPGRFPIVDPIINLSPGQVGITVNLDQEIRLFDLSAGISFPDLSFTDDDWLDRRVSEMRFTPRLGFRALHVYQRASSQVEFTALTDSFSNTNVILNDSYFGLGFGGRFEIPVLLPETEPDARLPVTLSINGSAGPAFRYSNGSASQISRCGDPTSAVCNFAYGTDPIEQRISASGISLTYFADLTAELDFNLGQGVSLGLHGGASLIGDSTRYTAPGPESNQPASFGSGPIISFKAGISLRGEFD